MRTPSDDHSAKLAEELNTLEHRTGIYEEAERAREGRLFPDVNETPDEYFNEEYDYTRRRTRKTYFSVADSDLRKQLISCERKIHAISLRRWDGDIQTAEREAHQAAVALGRLPWGLAAVVGGGCVALGYYMAGLSGSIGGAVVGIFMGFGTIANTKSERQRTLSAAQESLTQLKVDKE